MGKVADLKVVLGPFSKTRKFAISPRIFRMDLKYLKIIQFCKLELLKILDIKSVSLILNQIGRN